MVENHVLDAIQELGRAGCGGSTLAQVVEEENTSAQPLDAAEVLHDVLEAVRADGGGGLVDYSSFLKGHQEGRCDWG